jgi:phospholipid transport system substrate-binding protein
MVKKILLVVSFLLFSNNVLADDKKDAENFINNFGGNIIKIAGNEEVTLDARRGQLVKLIDKVVDNKWIARFVLARNYRTISQEQRDRFEGLYRDFMIHTYAPSFNGYSGESFEIVNTAQKGKYFMVKCFFIPKDNPRINISFRLKRNTNDNSFSILDVIAEGVSLIETQRSEFGSVISNKGIEGFLNDLEARVKKLKAN